MIEIGIILLLSGVCSYFIYRAYTIAGVLTDQQEYIKELEDMSTYMYDQINNSLKKMNEIDYKGAFEADDETGTTFGLLKDVIKNLEKEFNAEEKESK